MPVPNVVLLEVEPDGSAQVYRYTADGAFGGDTWHESEADAYHQLDFEYGEALGPWQAVPDTVNETHDYAVSWIQEHSA
jgi:hypothetical protein